MPPKRATTLQMFGHAGGHLREALLEALDYPDDWWMHVEIDFTLERHNKWWSQLSGRRRASWLLGQLWNCTDIVPACTRQEVQAWFPDSNEPITYAVLSRLLAQDLRARATGGSL